MTELKTSVVVFVDTMIVIEAVRTSCWNAITGQRQIVTVEECADELHRGDASGAGYVPVSEQDIERATVEPLPDEAAVKFRLEYAAADGLDPGERDLLALAYGWNCEFAFCCCDKAAVVGRNASRGTSRSARSSSSGVCTMRVASRGTNCGRPTMRNSTGCVDCPVGAAEIST